MTGWPQLLVLTVIVLRIIWSGFVPRRGWVIDLASDMTIVTALILTGWFDPLLGAP